MTAEPQLTTQRQFERRQLISLFAALEPGGEITFEEIKAMTGLDVALDRGLIYSVTEHCREVLDPSIIVKPRRGVYRRLTDEELAGEETDKRRQRIYRQAQRGVGEAAAVVDPIALDTHVQHELLAKQAIFGAVALASHRENVGRLAERVKSRAISQINPQEVVDAARSVR